MRLILGGAPLAYAKSMFDQWKAALEKSDKENFKRGEDVDIASSRLILKDRTTGARYIVFVDSGVLDIELVP
jgi:hypothetical protein